MGAFVCYSFARIREFSRLAYSPVPGGPGELTVQTRSMLQSKRAFSFIMFLFTLSEEDDNQRLPVLTIPAG